ncbi:hypothetical protein DM01DRAFT_137812 [Hesseltinella vesiculosa]|uniref:Uncharacterized protein n=1 Tax=Hesseltinella vesiculosa TaxID=101127 RepID=A0A1X2GJQ4_9FUNG|nr:hypothetical protein DM01DRAFT_137812 [Hesseltinella vesiculosa]
MTMCELAPVPRATPRWGRTQCTRSIKRARTARVTTVLSRPNNVLFCSSMTDSRSLWHAVGETQHTLSTITDKNNKIKNEASHSISLFSILDHISRWN